MCPTEGSGPGTASGFVGLFGTGVPLDGDVKGFPDQPFERRRVPGARPDLELDVAGRLEP
jgi:hypothetical protein